MTDLSTHMAFNKALLRRGTVTLSTPTGTFRCRKSINKYECINTVYLETEGTVTYKKCTNTLEEAWNYYCEIAKQSH